jgi:hypothetical protein
MSSGASPPPPPATPHDSVESILLGGRVGEWAQIVQRAMPRERL